MSLGGNSYFNAYSSKTYKRYLTGASTSQSQCTYNTISNEDGSTTYTMVCSNGSVTKTIQPNGSFIIYVVVGNYTTTIERIENEDGSNTTIITYPDGTQKETTGYWHGPSSPNTSIYLS